MALSVNKMDLSWIVSPLQKEIFMQEYLETLPLLVKRSNPGYFENLVTIEDINYLISQGRTLGSFDIRLVTSERYLDPEEYYIFNKVHNVSHRVGIDIKKVLQMFDKEKATIVIEDTTAVWPPLKRLAMNLNNDLVMCSTGANMYITPSLAQGFNAHYDTHDVFILQVYGKKKWRVYDNPVVLPLVPQHSQPFDKSKLKLLYEVEIEQGDTLYMPRGFVHEAETSDSISAHITISMRMTTWTRVILDYIRELAIDDNILKMDFGWEGLRENGSKEELVQQLKTNILGGLTLDRLEGIASRYLNDKNNFDPVETLSK